ncbi:MAG: TonB family protein [Acidobacteria bacterium]|nr:TonB family protein [Acidobacteriota bacterium]
MNLLRLDGSSAPGPGPEPEPDRQLPLFEETPAPRPDPALHLLPEIDEERATIVGRETFLVSLVVHIAAIMFFVANPDLINLGSPTVVLPKPEEKEVTMLYEPPAPPRPKLQAPPEPVQPMTLPRAAGSPDSQLDKIQPPPGDRLIEPPQPRPPAKPLQGTKDKSEELMARMDPIGIPDFSEEAKKPPLRQPSLESIPTPEAPAPSEAQLRLPTFTPPSRGTDAILRQMARQHAEGGQGSGAISSIVPNPGDPNFNLPGPQILSDTMGVNFDPYLLRVYLSVQRNWYSVIPEIARLGRKGRVILQFTIRKNGAVESLQLMDGSGTSSMDSAALSSIRLSNPFPPLPPDFPGNDILLRFGYYYNMQPEYRSAP